jgi:hypothetical protein
VYEFDNLVLTERETPGIADELYLAPVSWIKTIAPVENLTYVTQTHEFFPGYGFLKLLLAPEKNYLNVGTVGEKGSQGFDGRLNFFLPGSYALLHGTIAALLNQPVIAIARDVIAGLAYQIGSELHPAYLTPGFTTGTTKDGAKGYSNMLSAYANGLYLYDGSIIFWQPEDLYLITEDGDFILTEDEDKFIVEL